MTVWLEKAGKLKTAFEQERRTASLPDGIGLSIGIASASHDVPSLEDAVRAADANMYRDKLGERQA